MSVIDANASKYFFYVVNGSKLSKAMVGEGPVRNTKTSRNKSIACCR